jgi:single-stranded-DNA-specific exonuclease
MLSSFQDAAQLIRDHRNDSIQIISHMDADGVCAAAIISKSLDRLNAKHHVKFVHMLYRDVVQRLEPVDLTIFTDLGSSQLKNLREKFEGSDIIIADHHKPEKGDGWPELIHLNAHHQGLDGATEICGSGMSYLISRELDAANNDLSAIAIVGAVGDIQNAWGKLRGFNRKIAQTASDAGVLECKTDLLLYGRHTRPIFKALESFTDPPIPGVSSSVAGCVSLLKDLGIPYRSERGWRTPVDLTNEEKQKLATELISRAYMHVPKELVQYVPGLIIGEAYTILGENARSPLQDADEFSTCINSTARHEQPLIGFEIAKGDRGVYYRTMLNLLRYHRRCIAEGMGFVEQEGLKRTPKGYLQYFDATGVTKETFIGTIASLALGHRTCDPYKPIAGIFRERGVARISARCSKLLFLKGLDLANAIREAAKSVDGEGGGHAVACGAQVDEAKLQDFLNEFENQIATKLD